MISIEFGPILAALKDLEKLEAQLPKIADEAGKVALHVARQALDQGIYNTAPGHHYVRTHDVRDRLQVMPIPGGFELSDDSDHARAIEYGSVSIGGLDPKSASVDINTGRISGLPGADAYNSKPGYYGRSGLNYRQPEPFIAPGAVLGFYKLTKLVELHIQEIFKRHAR